MQETVWGIDRLREVALDQHGYVTAAQAAEAGVSRSALSKLAARDRVERVAHGVYRVPQVPSSHYDRFMLAVLWTGAPEAVVSHESALDLYGVCEINPKAIDVTVGPGRRISRRGGEGYRVHREGVPDADRGWREEVPVVSLKRALEQCLASGTPSYLLEQAIDGGLAGGFISGGEAAALASELGRRDGE